MAESKPKHTVIVDADLHIQDPHDIILSYFNTKNDSQFVKGEKKQFRNRLLGFFIGMIFMKFFFQEMFTNFSFFIAVAALSVLIGLLLAEVIPFFVRILNNSIKKDAMRGLFFQITFITIIVILAGLFI